MNEQLNHQETVPVSQVPATIPPSLPQELSVDQVVARVNKVRELMKRVMKEGHHYGTIPGTPKPTIYKAGAELLCMCFMLDPQYERQVTMDGDHREIFSRCVLYHIPTGNRVGSGEGSCSTRETKYAWRKGSAACPSCGNAETLRRSKQAGKGFYCWTKLGGCGKEFASDDPRIASQSVARVPNPDLADTYNTVLKMANKRGLVAAVLNATAASEIFTQDLEDFRDEETANAPDEDNSYGGTAAESHQQMPSDLARDMDLGNGKFSPRPENPTDKPSEAQLNVLRDAIAKKKLSPDDVAALLKPFAGVKELGDLTAGQYKTFLEKVVTSKPKN